jgi:hypothetical protein
MKEKDPWILSGNLLISIWIVFIVALTVVAALEVGSKISNNNINNINYDKTIAPWNISSQSDKNKSHTYVLTGVYLNRVPKISMKDSNFDMDFYIWFRWRGNNVSPGENFEIVNGEINKKQKQAEWASGDEHYEQYQVTASMNKYFNMMLFPLDRQNITIELEDSLNSIDELSYIPDTSNNSNMSSQIIVPGYDTKWIGPMTRVHDYETNFGSPWANSSASTYSQLIFGVSLSHHGWSFYFKLCQALFFAVLVAILSFFLRPHYEPRFVVGVGALFAGVANYYNILSMQPPVSYLTIADTMNLIGIATIFLSMFQSSISYYMYDHENYKGLYRRFDVYSALTFTSCYVFLNSWIIWMVAQR